MIQIGKTNKLIIKNRQDYGVHLDGGEAGDILLQKKYLSEKLRPGDEIEVFIYVDREERLLATTQTPYATVDQFAELRVVATTSAGAYLDWGLESDLFVPKSEQLHNMREGRSYIVFIFVSEKTNRITASSKLDKFISSEPPDYQEGEEVDLLIFEKTDLGYRAVINQTHGGIIYKNEVFQKLFIGQELKGYINKIREDQKIDLRLQESGYNKVDAVSQAIFNTIKDRGGKVALTDKSPPEEIYAMFGVSKKVFKKAIGALYKKRLIVIDTGGIKISNP